MSKALDREREIDLDALWNRGEPDLELDPDEGRIRAVRVRQAEPQGRGLLRAIGAATPLAIGAAGLMVSSVARWD